MRDDVVLLRRVRSFVKGLSKGGMGVPEITRGGVPGLVVADRYRLVECIGQGGMGRVWRATDEILDRQVAVKEMRIDGQDPEDSRTRLERNPLRILDSKDEGDRRVVAGAPDFSASLDAESVAFFDAVKDGLADLGWPGLDLNRKQHRQSRASETP